MIKNYSNRNYINSVKSWGAEGISPKNNNNLMPILVGASITVVIVGIYLYNNRQKQINLLRKNLDESLKRNLVIQRENEIFAQENSALTVFKKNAELMDEQVTID